MGYWKRTLASLLLIVFAFGFALDCDVSGQPVNREVMVSLAADCLSSVVESEDTLRYVTSGTADFIEAGLVDNWHNAGIEVVKLYAADSAGYAPYLAFDVTDVSVSYSGIKGSNIERTVSINMLGTLYGPANRVRETVSCPADYGDTVKSDQLDRLEDSAIPETIAPRPGKSFIRRYLPPVIVAAASAVSVYLFFSIRSDEAGN